MRKRLRKKLNRGEFDVPVVGLAFQISDEAKRTTVIEELIAMVEATGMLFGGGGGGLVWSGFLQPESYENPIADHQLDSMRRWLRSHPSIGNYAVGQPMRDSELDAVFEADPGYPQSLLDSAR